MNTKPYTGDYCEINAIPVTLGIANYRIGKLGDGKTLGNNKRGYIFLGGAAHPTIDQTKLNNPTYNHRWLNLINSLSPILLLKSVQITLLEM